MINTMLASLVYHIWKIRNDILWNQQRGLTSRTLQQTKHTSRRLKYSLQAPCWVLGTCFIFLLLASQIVQFWGIFHLCGNGLGKEGKEIVMELWRSDPVRRLNKEYVSKLQMGEEGELSMIQQNSESIEKRGGEVIEFLVTSLSRFHFYEIDFGWGKPDWFSTCAWSFDLESFHFCM
ncbi:hypothetical protein F8388_022943 [Cannabis sativa]|uniref:Uncharacterized protein n=1 Tax=Cannabis sativa TaxID=3483 RepID=A0A7J6HV13_CANSA|nr:hypothetical protein F8388_022943 [Cannabis sativa]KAF4398701.1 hypothetical protein G4B88_017127 [Cannabis sativa]